ncbi:hypothetical protein BDV36DRAFT_217328 [Aspergillus pseudocaelatus]|uniref:Uncharacterized protein n=1 Tax=Aspergillus pseudocaelatus TaxID=1825620 RepID=A0ABQ6WFG9_9EURO|nr:hypothetical protein BDV36DRAFT_217328 [Aspergillus pseudocaelatus]
MCLLVWIGGVPFLGFMLLLPFFYCFFFQLSYSVELWPSVRLLISTVWSQEMMV